MLQRTDRAAAARAMDEPLAQGGIEAVEESLRRRELPVIVRVAADEVLLEAGGRVRRMRSHPCA